jgi:uncharacterized protein (DUF427 family)
MGGRELLTTRGKARSPAPHDSKETVMTLTLGTAPLGTSATEARNYEIDGPKHRLLFTPFPRRIRATFAGQTVLDTTAGMLLHESNILPVLYAPLDDFHTDLLTGTDHSTHCPFKGDASYYSIVVGDRTATNAVWYYPEPVATASWLEGYAACYWARLDAWFDEDERVEGHLRDPYHRVDVRRSSREVRVVIGGEAVASSKRALVLSETGLPNRWYLPADDVRMDRLGSSTTTTVCAYKGEASYWHYQGDGSTIADAAFSYHHPLDGMEAIADRICFVPTDAITLEIDGQPAAG